MKRAFLLICAIFALAVPAAAIADNGGTPQQPAPCSDSNPPPCTITLLPGPPPPPPDIIMKLEAPIPLMSAPKKDVTHQDPRYSDVVQAISGVSSAQARCWSQDDWSFFVPFFGEGTLGVTLGLAIVNPATGDAGSSMDDKIQLAPSICPRLDMMVYRHKRPSASPQTILEMATSLAVLTHESEHVAGYTDESMAQCRALQQMESAGVMLGLGKAYSHKLSQHFFKYGQGSMPLAYKNALCVNGGKWDINTGPGWPS